MSAGADDEPAPWTAAEHVLAGEAALKAIRTEEQGAVPQPVCHHFVEVSPSDPMEVSSSEKYAFLEPRFEAIKIEWASDRLEGWEVSSPDSDWIRRRVPALLQIAELARLEYLGWSWEPAAGQPVAASMVNVINNRTI